MARIAERTHVMMEQFMLLHNEGYSIAEIANKFNLSAFTVYNHLQEIAEANNVSRDSLLKVVRTARTERQLREEQKKVQVKFEEVMQGLTSAYKALQEVSENIDYILEEER